MLVAGGLLLALGLTVFEAGQADLAAAYAPPNSGEMIPDRDHHLWVINEIFSCGDGSDQFIELFTPSGNQEVLTGRPIQASNLGATLTNTYIFPDNSGTPTTGRSLLLATSGFAGLPGGITPDFIIPNNFLFTGGGSVDFAGVFTLIYANGELPLDGVNSLAGNNTIGVNSPTNFAEETGSVTCPDPSLSVSKQTQSSTIQPDDLITYTLTVVSMGTLTNTNTVLTDTIPTSTTFVSADVTPTNGVLTWTLGDLLPSAIVTRTFVVSATASAGQTIVNSEYGVQSDQASATGLALETTVTMGLNVYLPIILKNFDPVGEHAADLPIQSLWR
jgi:uncharacterized repeat protein (TIGR01451 family)